MNEVYTRDQAMKRLDIKSRNAFKHLAQKHPESFILVRESSKFPRYDKAVLERFAKIRDSIKDRFHFA